MKSLSFNSPIYSNSIHHFSSLLQIPIHFSSRIQNVLYSETSNSKVELTPFRSPYLRDFEDIDNIIQCLKDGTSCQDLCIVQLAHRAKLGVSQEVIFSKVHHELVKSMCHKTEKGKTLKKGFMI